MINNTILLLYTCDCWHSHDSMVLVGTFSSRRVLNKYLNFLKQKVRLTEEDMEDIERFNQTQGKVINYSVSEEEINPDFENGDGTATPLISWLKTVKCPLCKSKKVRRDFDFPLNVRCCESCGCDFNTSGDILLNPNHT